MKIRIIQQQIISNYNRLSKLANVPSSEKNVVPLWGLTYKKNFVSGSISNAGIIERNNAVIQIVNGNEIQLKKRPLLFTWKRTLKNINRMLQNSIVNIENKDVVTKRVVDLFCFPQETIKTMTKSVKR